MYGMDLKQIFYPLAKHIFLNLQIAESMFPYWFERTTNNRYKHSPKIGSAVKPSTIIKNIV